MIRENLDREAESRSALHRDSKVRFSHRAIALWTYQRCRDTCWDTCCCQGSLNMAIPVGRQMDV